MTELDGTTQDNKCRTLEMSLELETNFPMWAPRTIVSADDVIVYTSGANMTSPNYDSKGNKTEVLGHLHFHGPRALSKR